MQARTIDPRKALALILGIAAPVVLTPTLGTYDHAEIRKILWSLVFSPAPEMQGYPYALHRVSVRVETPDGLVRNIPERDIDQTFRTHPFARVSLHRALRQPEHLAQRGKAFFCGHAELEQLFPAGSRLDVIYSRGNERYVVVVKCP